MPVNKSLARNDNPRQPERPRDISQMTEEEIIQHITNPEVEYNGIKRSEMPVAYILSKLMDADEDDLDPVDKQLILALFTEALSLDDKGNKTLF